MSIQATHPAGDTAPAQLSPEAVKVLVFIVRQGPVFNGRQGGSTRPEIVASAGLPIIAAVKQVDQLIAAGLVIGTQGTRRGRSGEPGATRSDSSRRVAGVAIVAAGVVAMSGDAISLGKARRRVVTPAPAVETPSTPAAPAALLPAANSPPKSFPHPRCDCGSIRLKTLRSVADQGDGSTRRRVQCLGCGVKFVYLLE